MISKCGKIEKVSLEVQTSVTDVNLAEPFIWKITFCQQCQEDWKPAVDEHYLIKSTLL